MEDEETQFVGATCSGSDYPLSAIRYPLLSDYTNTLSIPPLFAAFT